MIAHRCRDELPPGLRERIERCFDTALDDMRHYAGPAGTGSNVVAMPAVLLATEVWHWWIGVILFVVSVLAVLGLIGGYLKNVTAQRYPNKRQRDQQ